MARGKDLTIRFAHLADSHLGAFRDPILRQLNLEAFLQALDVVREEGCDFLVIAGDLFDTNLPDMEVVERTADGLRRLRDAGVRVYAIYGSHDRSPTEKGIVDVLESAGLFVNVATVERPEGNTAPEDGSDYVRLGVHVDGPTGAVISGIAGRRRSLERGLFDTLDMADLGERAREAPLAIFGYHGPVEGMLPKALAELAARDVMPSLEEGRLPAGFDYYALGHVHHRTIRELPGGGLAAYPGPTFGASFTDLADGRTKGLLVVEADENGRCQVRNAPVEVAPILLMDMDASGMSGEEASGNLEDLFEGIGPEGAVVLLRVYGELSAGRPADVGIPRARDELLARGARTVHVNRAGLRGPERRREGSGVAVPGGGDDGENIRREVLRNALEAHASPVPWLAGDDGLELALELIGVLTRARGGGRRDDHERALLKDAFERLDAPGRLKADPPPPGTGEPGEGGSTEGDGQGGATTLDHFQGGEGP